jgi:hypothetical protein
LGLIARQVDGYSMIESLKVLCPIPCGRADNTNAARVNYQRRYLLVFAIRQHDFNYCI